MVCKIAEGGMAVVWKARQDKLDRVVAVKVLLKRVDSDQQELDRFIYEARAAASLIHPNIVQVIDAGEREGFMYYVMEYVPGPTAGDVVDSEGAMAEARVLNIAGEVAEALDYAWRDHRVVHCDIKPDNLLLHRNGRTKIADLGLAQVLGFEGVKIEDDMTLGTPNYFPPEQALVEEGLDCRADMYALGATMYHLGTGQVPFDGLSPEEIASRQVHGQLPNPRTLTPRLTYGFCCLVERLMAKDPAQRYEDWSGVIRDILAVKEGRMIQTPLPEEIPGTIEHVELPASPRKGAKILRRSGGGQPIRRRGAARHPATGSRVRVTLPDGTRARPVADRDGGGSPQGQKRTVSLSHPAPRAPRYTGESLWPAVLGLLFAVVALYAWTVFKMRGG